MKKYLIPALIVALFTASPVCAERLNLTSLPVQTAGGYYVGAFGGYISGGTKANYYCDDFSSTSRVPSSFQVIVSSLSNITKTKFAGQTDALKKYQQVGWLMYQMQINPTNTAAIQFAMWSVFNPSTPTYEDSAAWLAASAQIDASSYDFSQMRIYTPTGGRNQEFIGGSVTAISTAPEPAEWLLLLIGLGLITYAVSRNREQVLVRIGTG